MQIGRVHPVVRVRCEFKFVYFRPSLFSPRLISRSNRYLIPKPVPVVCLLPGA